MVIYETAHNEYFLITESTDSNGAARRKKIVHRLYSVLWRRKYILKHTTTDVFIEKPWHERTKMINNKKASLSIYCKVSA